MKIRNTIAALGLSLSLVLGGALAAQAAPAPAPRVTPAYTYCVLVSERYVPWWAINWTGGPPLAYEYRWVKRCYNY